MQFTYRNPERSTDPSRAVPGARAVIVGALPYLLDAEDAARCARRRTVRVAGRVARYAWTDHYGRPPRRAAGGGAAPAARRLAAPSRSPTTTRWSIARSRTAPASAGSARTPTCSSPGAGSWFVLGSVVTTAPLRPAASPSRRRLRHVPPLHRRVPDRGDRRRRRGRRQPLPRRGCCRSPASSTRRFREALGDRIYGCDDCQEVCPPTVRLGAARAPATHRGPQQRTVDVLELLDADDDEVLATVRSLVPRRPRPAVAAAQRAGRARQRRPRLDAARSTPTSRSRRHASPATLPTTTRSCAPTPCGRRSGCGSHHLLPADRPAPRRARRADAPPL